MTPNLWQFCFIIAVVASATGYSISAGGIVPMRIALSMALGVAVVRAFLRAAAVHDVAIWTLAILSALAGFGLLGYLLGVHVHRYIKTKASHRW